MMELNSDDIRRFEDALTKFVTVIDNANAQPASTGNATITVNAGSVGVMVILVMAAFVLGVATFSSFSISSRMNQMSRRQDRQDDYIQAIYSIAPQLKPVDTTQQKEKVSSQP